MMILHQPKWLLQVVKIQVQRYAKEEITSRRCGNDCRNYHNFQQLQLGTSFTQEIGAETMTVITPQPAVTVCKPATLIMLYSTI